MTITRRTFLGGCALTLGGLQVFSGARAQTSKSEHVFVHVFLRGGFDGLNLVCPYQGNVRTAYESSKGENAIPQKAISPLTGDWGLYVIDGDNPSDLTRFKTQVWDSGRMAIVHACGLPSSQITHAHKQARERVKRGVEIDPCTGETVIADSGWLARYFNEVNHSSELPAVSIGHGVDETLLGFDKALSVSTAVNIRNDFLPLNANRSPFKAQFSTLLDAIYQGDEHLDESMQSALALVNDSSKLPTDDPLGSRLKEFDRLAQLLRTDAFGIRAATIEIGGWDSHTASPVRTSGYRNQLSHLANAITLFDANMVKHGKRYTMIVHSEFGRGFAERPRRFNGLRNFSGTDHGAGNIMLVIGDDVNGKKFYGDVPTDKVMTENYEIPVTTDYRTVIREVLGKQLGANTGQLANIFPNFSDTTVLGVVKGEITAGQGKPMTKPPAPNCTDPKPTPNPNPTFSDSFE